MRYNIRMTKKQLDVMAEALEFFTRFNSGQMEYMSPSLEKYNWDNHKDTFSDVRDIHDNAAFIMKRNMFGFQRNQHAGISSDIPEVGIGYEMYKMVLLNRHQEWQAENPDDTNYSVHSSEPLKVSDEPLIRITKQLKQKQDA